MNKIKRLLLSLTVLLPALAGAQNAFEVDYGNPQKYYVGGITVEGNN